MLTRRAQQHQFNFIHRLSWSITSRKFTLEMRVAAENREKFTKTRYFLGSRSFKVNDIGTLGKLVGSACYDKQQVCVYLQLFDC